MDVILFIFLFVCPSRDFNVFVTEQVNVGFSFSHKHFSVWMMLPSPFGMGM